MKLGFHVSIRGSIDKAVDRSVKMGINTFQIFTRNPRSWKKKNFNNNEISNFIKKVNIKEINPIFCHTPYLINLASSNEEIYHKSITLLKEEIIICEKLKIPFIVTHLGSNKEIKKKDILKRISHAINKAQKCTTKKTCILLENTAGIKNSVGSTFEELRYILDRIIDSKNVCVCLDTCHAFAAGYDLRTEKAVRNTLNKFDKILGLEKIKVIHLNDSKGDFNSHIDRHEHIGLGEIGEKGFSYILKSKISTKPLILETPIDDRRNDQQNLKKVIELIST